MYDKRTVGCCTRRHFLACQAMGIGGLALSWLLNQEGVRAETSKPDLDKPTFDLKPKPPHHEPRAKAMISLWMQGGPSHIDLCDPKPELDKLDGKKLPVEIKIETGMANLPNTDVVLASPWKFKKHGQCGMELSEPPPHLGEVVDDITLVRSMVAPTVNNHGQAIRAYQRADGSNRLGNSDRPSLGSWITYALGAESQNLPAFVALTDSGDLPVEGLSNWTNGFLPSIYQGTVIRPREPRIVNLDVPAYLKGEPQEALEFLERLNRRHLAENPGNDDLEARIASFQLAARMQLVAAEALDLSRETKETQRLYGLDDPLTREYGGNCLLARRLIERGVRFVQVYTASQYWDHHGRIVSDLPAACRRTDKPVAALMKDLKRRGLLDTTIVHWGGEMGRLPVIQGRTVGNRASIGRDHNVAGFSMWLAGGGFKGGHIHGATDEFGFKAQEDPVNHADYHATLMHLFGLDPQKLVYRLGTQELRLPDGRYKGQIVRGLLKDPPKA